METVRLVYLLHENGCEGRRGESMTARENARGGRHELISVRRRGIRGGKLKIMLCACACACVIAKGSPVQVGGS